MSTSENSTLMPRCEYVQGKATDLNSIYKGLRPAQRQQAAATKDLPRVEHGLREVTYQRSEDILRREFLVDGQPSSSETLQSLITQLQWQSQNSAYEYGHKLLDPDSPHANLIAHYEAMEASIMAKLTSHRRKWHKLGNKNCYHLGEDWQPPVTSMVAIARIATDLAFRK